MAETKLSDAELSARAGFGEPVKSDKPEEGKPEDEKEETQTSDESEEGNKSAEESEDLSESEEDIPSESEEPEEETEEEEEEESDDKEKHTVPYKRLRAERIRRKEAEQKAEELMGGLKDLPKQVSEAVKAALIEIAAKPKEEQKDESEKAAEELAEELSLDAAGLAKIFRKAVELAGKNKLAPELEERLKQLDQFEKAQKEEQEKVKFENEWNSFVPNLKKKYPDVSDEVLSQAKELMDELAHSKEHHTHELDYIFWKNSKKFQAVLKTAPKSSGGEKTKRIGESSFTPEEGEKLTPIEYLTPELMKKREQEDIARNKEAAQQRDYTIINPIS